MKNHWWKILAVVLVLYSILWGLLGDVPARPILHETIRNLYFHVPMWFGMMIIMTVSLVQSIRYLSGGRIEADHIAGEAANTGMLLGAIGIATGMIWAKYTWGAWWTNDPHLNGAAITMLAYLAYAVLRNSLDDRHRRARIAAVYNIFAFIMMVVFIIILPRTTDSLHPGKGGNPGFDIYDTDNRMRMIFYPAVIGWALIAWWITQLRARLRKIGPNNS